MVLYQKSHSFAALTLSISDTSPTRVKIPYARAFHEVISIYLVFTYHRASLQAEFVETIGGSAVIVELEFELHIVLDYLIILMKKRSGKFTANDS